MKKSLFASLFLVTMCAIASGTHATPAAAPAVTPAPVAPHIGACRWFCDGPTAFRTEAACAASCSHECDAVC